MPRKHPAALSHSSPSQPQRHVFRPSSPVGQPMANRCQHPKWNTETAVEQPRHCPYCERLDRQFWDHTFLIGVWCLSRRRGDLWWSDDSLRRATGWEGPDVDAEEPFWMSAWRSITVPHPPQMTASFGSASDSHWQCSALSCRSRAQLQWPLARINRQERVL